MAIVICVADLVACLSTPIRYLFRAPSAGRVQLTPAKQLARQPHHWISTGEDPQFSVVPKPRTRIGGWALVTFDATSFDSRLEPILYFNDGGGFRGTAAIRLPRPDTGLVRHIVKLPHRVKALRLDPLAEPGRFRVTRFDFETLSAIGVIRHLLGHEGKSLSQALRVMWRRHSGMVNGMEPQENSLSQGDYADWIAENDTLSNGDRAAIGTHIETFRVRPRISVIMPVFNPRLAWLDDAVRSVRAQLYADWELCIVDDASTDAEVTRLIERHAAADPRIRFCRQQRNGGIVSASNVALDMASGEWVAMLDHDDCLTEHALYLFAAEIERCPDSALIYSDYDHLTAEGVRVNPYFKPDWNYDLCLGQNLANHLTAIRRDLVTRVGGFRAGFEGSQDWDLVLRAVEAIPRETIRHVPWVLYHWRVSEDGFSQSRASEAHEAGRHAVESHLERTGQEAAVAVGPTATGHLRIRRRLPADPPLVSLVVPTRDRLDLMRHCVVDLLERTDYPRIELVVVDNGSVERETHAYYHTLRDDGRVRILEEDGEFNFSRLCNRGVEAATGEVYVLLNNDIEVINADWLSEIVSHAVRPEVGAVGAKLYYPDDDTIQHAGVILGVGGVAGHAHKRLPRHSDGYFGRASLTQEISAVTAACLAGRVSVFHEIGGLDERNLKVAFNDVDFCLRLGRAGYKVIWTPLAELYHIESASRGSDMTPDKAERFRRERDWMVREWSTALERDPAYNPNLTLKAEDFRLAFPTRRVAPWTGMPIADPVTMDESGPSEPDQAALRRASE